jgi:hypothetical protein
VRALVPWIGVAAVRLGLWLGLGLAVVPAPAFAAVAEPHAVQDPQPEADATPVLGIGAAPRDGEIEAPVRNADGSLTFDRDAVAKDVYGPFYVAPPPSDSSPPSGVRGAVPVLAVGRGAFCFVEDAGCRVALLASVEVAGGVNILGGSNGPDMPYAHYGGRAGIAVRPLQWARARYHPWGLGFVASWSRGRGSYRQGDSVEDQDRTDTLRLALLNQIWMQDKAHAFHVDFTLGAARSDVLDRNGRNFELWGTALEVAAGFGGWGALYAGADFLDRDTRFVFGARIHGIAGLPLVGLVLAGLAAGGAL